MNLPALNETARQLVAPGKGLLAADESTGTIKRRFDDIGVESTETSRRDYRELLFRTQDAMSDSISGVILYDETIWQGAADGTPLVDLITAAGSIPGIKVDKGTQPLPGFPGETITEGLDGLDDRLAAYRTRGARFAKWRAVSFSAGRFILVPRRFSPTAYNTGPRSAVPSWARRGYSAAWRVMPISGASSPET